MKDIDTQWAWSQVEAMADGSLSAKDRRRMRFAMAREPRLQEAVDRARALRRALRGLASEPVPRSLRARLLRIASERGDGRDDARRGLSLTRTPIWSWASAAGTAMAVTAALMLTMQSRLPSDDERTAALREFEIAMGYLQRSYAIAGEQVRRATERGLRDALELGSEAGGDASGEEGNGG